MMNIQTMNRPAQAMKAQKGFTLIEIIAVLIVLAVLAAVAVPKYMDVVTEAQHASAEAAVAEGFARLNNSSARLMLATGAAPASAAAVLVDLATITGYDDAGDYGLTYDDSVAGVITVTALGKANTSVTGGTANGDWVPAN